VSFLPGETVTNDLLSICWFVHDSDGCVIERGHLYVQSYARDTLDISCHSLQKRRSDDSEDGERNRPGFRLCCVLFVLLCDSSREGLLSFTFVLYLFILLLK